MAQIGTLTERNLLITGVALFAGEGSKTGERVAFTNAYPAMIVLFCTWLRCFFQIDESRLCRSLHLYEGLDLRAAQLFWSELTAIPVGQFTAPHRENPNAGIRNNKHENGCVSVRYACARTHRAVMGLVGALLASTVIPG